MRSRHFFATCLSFAWVLGSTPAFADQAILCIRGKSFEPNREFLQTRQLKLNAVGPPLGDLLFPMASRAVREKIWPELKTEEVQIAAFDAQLCGTEPTAEVTVSYAQDDLIAIRAESTRGPADQVRLNTVARQSAVKQPPPKVPPTGTSSRARRHEWVQLYFATTRQPTGAKNAADAFGKNRADALTFGTVDISIPADHRWAKLESPSVLRLEWDVDPKRHVKLADTFKVFSAKDIKAELVRQGSAFDKPGVLLFVHGFNNSFSEAAQRAAQLAYDLAFPGPTVLFSWPSEGDVLSYARDGEQASTAWRQMAEVLDLLAQLGPGVPVYVVAHSMGNRILTQGLALLLRQRPSADRAFRQVVLASPDVGEEEFRQRWINDLKSTNPPRYTLYASNQDLPVAFSAWLHGERRLGSGGAGIAVHSGLDSVDATAITKEWFGLSHSYFGDNETVMSDLFLVIHQGLEPKKRPRLLRTEGKRGEYWEFRK